MTEQKRNELRKGFTYPNVVRHMTVFFPACMLLVRLALLLSLVICLIEAFVHFL